MPTTNASLSLILVALGVLGVILSFMVPDRKKSVISLILAFIIIAAGCFQYSKQVASQREWRNRMRQATQGKDVNMEELRERLRNKAKEAQKNLKKSTSQ